MSKGLLYISFGEGCDRLAAHAVAYSRQFTDLPICILTNIKERDSKWDEVPNVFFIEVDGELRDNRDYKTQMNKHSPFDETIYLDCDSVIQKPGIENVFTTIGNKDVLLNLLIYWHRTSKIIKLYREAMKETGTGLPLSVYNGAFICFKKNCRVDNFFLKWNSYWKASGGGREMPALACAIKQSSHDLEIVEVQQDIHEFFAPDYHNEKCVVQHKYSPWNNITFFEKFRIPVVELSKPFDTIESKDDWIWVELD